MFCLPKTAWPPTSHNMVHDQLADQKISFPPQSTAVKGGALDPAEFPGLQQYAGQAVDSGPKAKAYANQFIAKHLEGVNKGATYSETSSQAQQARAAANTAKASNDPNFATLDAKATTLEGQAQTLFRGETLRGLLLYAWGWSLVGSIAFYVGIAAAIGAALLLGLAAWGYFHVRHNGVNHS